MQMITACEIPDGADDAFRAAWEPIHSELRTQPGFAGGALHRSIAPMTPYRFVHLGRWESAESGAAAARVCGAAADALPFAVHAALYEAVSSTERLTGTGGDVVLINFFEVAAGDDRQFIAGWERANEFLCRRPGYLSTRLHRSLQPAVAFRFVNIARWSSPESFLSATGDPGFRAAAGLPYPAHPGLYTVTASV